MGSRFQNDQGNISSTIKPLQLQGVDNFHFKIKNLSPGEARLVTELKFGPTMPFFCLCLFCLFFAFAFFVFAFYSSPFWLFHFICGWQLSVCVCVQRATGHSFHPIGLKFIHNLYFNNISNYFFCFLEKIFFSKKTL